MQESSIKTQVIAGTIATLAAIPGGFHNAWPSPSLVKLQAKDSDLPVTSSQGAWITSIYFTDCVFGGLLLCMAANKWGRKPALLLAMIPFIVASVLIAVAQNFWTLIIARSIAGLGFGGSLSIVMMYSAEIASDRIRGAFGALCNLMTNTGVLVVYCVGPWTSRMGLAYVGLAIPIIFIIAFVWMPESPYYLVMKNRTEDAKRSLSWLRGIDDLRSELKKVEESIENEENGTLKELIMTPGNRKALIIISLIIISPQLSGISAILAYTGLIFDASGSEMSSSVSAIVIGIVQLVSGVLSVFIVDLAGRRPLLLLSFGASIIFLLAEALYFQLQAIGTDVSSISWLPLTALVGYIVFFALGLGSVPFIVLSEVLPCNLKAAALTYAVCIATLSSAAITKLYQVIADAYGIHVCFYAFAACAAALAVCVYFLLPETKQKSFSDIQDGLRDSTNCELPIPMRKGFQSDSP